MPQTWSVQCTTRLLIKLTPKGVPFSFHFLTGHRDDAKCCMQLMLLPKPFAFGCSGEGARDPCLPVGYRRDAPAGTVVGSGNFEECRAIAKGLIAGQCQDELCPIGDSMPVELQGRQCNGINGTACLAA